MPLVRLPLPDPGSPDLRSARHFLTWLGRSQLRGRVMAVLWTVLGVGGQAAQPLFIGRGVQAVIDGRARDVWTSGAVALLIGVVISYAFVMQHRQAVWNWIHAACQIRQLVARQASALGSGLSR